MPDPKFWDEDTSAPVHGAAIPTVGNAPATLTQAYAQGQTDAINSILAALRSAGIIAQD